MKLSGVRKLILATTLLAGCGPSQYSQKNEVVTKVKIDPQMQVGLDEVKALLSTFIETCAFSQLNMEEACSGKGKPRAANCHEYERVRTRIANSPNPLGDIAEARGEIIRRLGGTDISLWSCSANPKLRQIKTEVLFRGGIYCDLKKKAGSSHTWNCDRRQITRNDRLKVASD
jgi:hypothetical protein